MRVGNLISLPDGVAVSPRTPSVADLEALASRNALASAHLRSWRAGGFASFEQCLISLVLALARGSEELVDRELARLIAAPVTFPVGVAAESPQAAQSRHQREAEGRA